MVIFRHLHVIGRKCRSDFLPRRMNDRAAVTLIARLFNTGTGYCYLFSLTHGEKNTNDSK